MPAPLVSIGRDTVEVQLFDTKGGVVKLYKALTVQQQTDILTQYGGKDDFVSKKNTALESIINCFIEWNVGADGKVFECTHEVLNKFSQRDLFAMLQACTGQELIDEYGNFVSSEAAAKKGLSA